jgi:hypothetical protein
MSNTVTKFWNSRSQPVKYLIVGGFSLLAGLIIAATNCS